ncbi:hypothetical protein CRYUN_Cryun11dG0093800 [Craigia yunnanensis]
MREEKGEESRREEWFLLPDSKLVMKTDAGEMRVIRSLARRIIEKPLHIGFITMEPKTFFIPQYLDSSLILFVRTGEGQKLHIICSIDPSESLNFGTFQSFFIGRGTYPTSIIAGFGPKTLPIAFNKRSPDFRNNYGWSIVLDGSEYGPLKDSGIGIYLVNLTAGSMLAPHVNPRATEYGIVLRGIGRIQIVYPNGTLAMDAKVKEGDVFLVPRYFAFCHIASRTGLFEFFGLTTLSHKNRPQFLVGANSVLHTLNTLELAAALGVSEERIKRVINVQREAMILPSPIASPPDYDEKKMVKFEAVPKVIKNFGREMILGFD